MTINKKKINDIDEMLQYATDIYNSIHIADHFYSDKESDLQVGIYINKDTHKIIISFRGTESLKDITTDLKVIKVKYDENIRVHKGFYDQLFRSNIYNEFYNQLKELIEQYNYNIYITGHSLGGALSSLFTYRLASEYTNLIINNITFASPRIGNYYWKKAFNSMTNINTLRVYVNSDPIPLTPSFNYWHIGKKLKLRSGNLFYYVNDHRTAMYNRLIKKLKINIEYEYDSNKVI